MRKKIIAGNWKMNKTFDDAMALTSEVVHMLNDEYKGRALTVLIPPFLYVNSISRMLKGNVFSGAQNCHQENNGAFTGEVSAAMIKSCGAEYVIVGHSERRQYFGETSALLAIKVTAVLANDLTAIYCCGETLEEREANNHFDVLKTQISEGLFHLTGEQMKQVVIAYEPVWAIGTGKTASTAQAQEVHQFIRGLIRDRFGVEIADNITIQYGGSVKADNAVELFSAADIDGALVGGAALQARSFVDIVKAMK